VTQDRSVSSPARHRITSLLIAAGALILVYVFVSLTVPDSFGLRVFSDLVYCGLVAASYFFTLPNQVVSRGRAAAFWTLISAGFGIWLLASVLWAFYELILRRDINSNFWGDAMIFFHVAPLIAAFAVRPHLGDGKKLWVSLTDSLLVMIWTGYLFAFVVLPWDLLTPDQMVYNKNFDLLYGGANAALVFVALVAWGRSRGYWRAVYLQICGAAFLYCLGSYIVNTAISAKLYYSGSIYDVPLVASLAWFVGVGLVGQRRRAELQAELRSNTSLNESDSANSVWGPRMAIVAILSVPLVEMVNASTSLVSPTVSHYRLGLTLGTLAVLTGLFIFRQNLAHRSAALASAYPTD